MNNTIEMKEGYLQPVCKVYQVHIEQMIATSNSQTSTESLTEEDFEW